MDDESSGGGLEAKGLDSAVCRQRLHQCEDGERIRRFCIDCGLAVQRAGRKCDFFERQWQRANSSLMHNDKPFEAKTLSQLPARNAIELKAAPIEFANLYVRDLAIAPFPVSLIA